MIWCMCAMKTMAKPSASPLSSETENSSVAGGGILRKLQVMAKDDGQIIPYLISTSIVDSFC